MTHSYLLSAAICALLLFTEAASAATPTAKEASKKTELPWTTSFDEAAKLAVKDNKPLFLYFSGSDWCSWCMKMDHEILETPEFQKAVSDKFIFYKADFPIYATQDPKVVQSNEELKNKYHISGFPTIVLLTPKLQEFGKLNYRQDSGEGYADYVLKQLDEQKKFEQGTSQLDRQSPDALQKLYERASQLGMTEIRAQILAQGLTYDSIFFMKEQYRTWLQEGKIADAETVKLRRALIARDLTNKERLAYDIALLDFETLSKKIQNSNDLAAAIQPLCDYLVRYGDKDSKSRWQIEMIISQTLHNNAQYEEAMTWARTSHSHAPVRYKISIAKHIDELKKRNDPVLTADAE